MEQKRKITPLSRLRVKKREDRISSVERQKEVYGNSRGVELLTAAASCWAAMDRFRVDRERNKRYSFGRQWDDIICVDGEHMTEAEWIIRQGSVPLKNNHIRRLMSSVLGVWRGQARKPTCIARDRNEQSLGEIMTTALEYNMDLNRMDKINAIAMMEFLISGFSAQRLWYGPLNDTVDCWNSYIQPNNFFIDNNMRDVRGWDISLIGEIHDVSWGELCSQFAKCPDDFKRLERIYSVSCDNQSLTQWWSNDFGFSKDRNWDFIFTSDASRCRVVEIWRKEQKARWRCHDTLQGRLFKCELEDYEELVEKVNAQRLSDGREAGLPDDEIPLIETEWFVDNYWYYYFVTPTGEILEEGETPYKHGQHPYVFVAYPFIDGEIHSFVSDIIDQQRYTNRLITLYDFMIRASAKGLVMFPEECIPEGMSREDLAGEWARFDGMIFYKGNGTQKMPQQISANSTNIGLHEMLNLQLKFFEEISGVNGALQGKTGYAGTSAALYNQQTQNATTSLLDLLETYSNFTREVAIKTVKNIQQFYDDKRMFQISGKTVQYEPQKIRNVEFDLSISENTQTPVYRQMANDILLQLFQLQAINVEQLLQYGSFPFADDLLQSIQSQKEQSAQGQAPEGMSPELMQQAAQGADMDAVNKAYEAIKGNRRSSAA